MMALRTARGWPAAPLVAALLLLVWAAPAAAAALDGLQATAITTADAARIDARLDVLRANGTGVAPTGSVEGEAGRIVADLQGERDATSVAGGSPNPTRYRDSATLRDASVRFVRLGAYLDLHVTPLGPEGAEAVLQAVGVTVARPGPANLGPYDYVQPDDARPVAAAGSVAATTGSSVSVTLRGSFALRIWDADVRLEDGDGTREFRTGQSYTDLAGEPGGVRVAGQSDAAELLLRVEGGELRIDLAGVAQALLVAPAMDVALEGQASVIGPRGVAGLGDVLELDGRLALRATAVGDALGVAVAGDVRGATSNGQAIAITGPDTPGAAWWALLVPVAVVAGAVVGQRAAWDRRMQRLREAMERDDHARAARLFGPLLLSRRHRPDALFLGTLALARLERATQAMRLLRNEGLWRGNAPGIRLFLLAHSHALLGQADAARQSLAASLAEAPELRSEASENPLLAPLLRGPAGQRDPDGYT